MTTIALVGNPNSGKTTLFNVLTGTRQRVGNWPGVTVEKKTGEFRHGGERVSVVDLPGTYTLESVGDAIDESIARNAIQSATEPLDVLVNVIDASSLARGLYMTTELLETGKPMVIALNMIDVADRHGIHVDSFHLSQVLGCPVVPMIASDSDGVGPLKDAIENARLPDCELPKFTSPEDRYHFIDRLLRDCSKTTPVRHTITDRIDAVVLHPLLAFPIFLAAMYLMFLFSINVGSAFIDLFDGVGNVLFVEGPRQLLTAIGLPEWLTVLLADGVGGGVQLVGTFIPVIGALFLVLSFLEDTGYMGRVAFIVDRLLRRLGLPGKSFVPLIVGFGCNVPSVMATRTLDNQPDRILTTIMAPYMSCGARLTVYTLFAAAFFPSNGQNIVFALYLIGIIVAVLSAMVVRKYLVQAPQSAFVLELPAYHLPTIKNLTLQTWQRLKGFVVRAGKAIVAVVVILNVVNSVGTDGSFNNQNSEKSVLSAIGRTITPVFHPMGITDDNWPATVGIFTGIFAKEVVVGTLDALYSPHANGEPASLSELLEAAVVSVPANLSELGDSLLDPLGIAIESDQDLQEAAAAQEVDMGTLGQMQLLFDGQLGAFSYLLFVLLYMPCVATIGVILKEIGAFWAVFSTTWSVVVAYTCAVLCYQIGNFAADPAAAALWIGLVSTLAALAFVGLIRFGQRRAPPLIPLVQLD
jgi:ferrous iron transport protein B